MVYKWKVRIECVMRQIKTWHVNNLSSRYAVLPPLFCNVIVCGFCGDKSPRKIKNSEEYSLKLARICTRMPVHHDDHWVWNFKSTLILPFVLNWLSNSKGYPHARSSSYICSLVRSRFTWAAHILQNVCICPSNSSTNGTKANTAFRKNETRSTKAIIIWCDGSVW